MNKNKVREDCCYEYMTKSVGGQSQPSECWDEPLINEHERIHKSFYGDNGFDWSGMKGE